MRNIRVNTNEERTISYNREEIVVNRELNSGAPLLNAIDASATLLKSFLKARRPKQKTD